MAIKTRRMFAGGATETTTTGALAASGALTVGIASSTGWPDGSTGKFAIVVDPGTASEEKMLVTSRSGTSLTVGSGDRGYDGTSAVAHNSGATIYITHTAVDDDEANEHASDAALHLGVGKIAAANMFAAGVVDNAALGALAVTAAKIAADAVITAKILDLNVTTAKINDLAVTTGKVNDLAVTAAKIAADAVTTAKILDANVTYAKLEAAVECRLRLAGTQNIASGASAAISWDTEEADASGFIAVPGSSLVVPASLGGIYAITVKGVWAPGGAGGYVQIVIGSASTAVNGTYSGASPNLSGTASSSAITIVVRLPAAATIQAKFGNNHSLTVDISGSSMSVTRVA